MTDNNIWGLLSKKMKANTLSIPTKPTKTATTITAPTNTESSTPKTVKPAKIKVKKVKPQKAQTQVQMQQQTQQMPKYNLSDFKFATTGDNVGIHIFVTYQNQPIHKFTLPTADYVAWHRFQSQQKYDYARMRVNPIVFCNDANLIHQVILTICNILEAVLKFKSILQLDNKYVLC